jgi:hypothetical protein
MSAVVQATCPGCKKVLRIPAEWMRQPIRCKHCGMILNAKPTEKPATATPRPVPPPVRNAVTVRPPPPAAPAPVAAVDPDSPFDDLVDDDAGPPRRRTNHNAGAVLFVSVLVVLMMALGFAIFLVKFGGKPANLAAAVSDEVSPDKPTPDKPTRDKPAPDKSAQDKPVVIKESESDDPSRPASDASDARDKAVPFPRRALVISVHGYLFANPVGASMPMQAGRNVTSLPDRLSNGLRIPHNQIALLSDAAARGQARPPIKPVIEETLATFLATTRAQDRIVVLFAGHAVEAGDETYLVPLEGELDRPDTLISLKKVLADMAKCPARQKMFVLDVCRLNPVFGAERPGGEAMGAKLAEAIKSPPAGVQVWSACGPGQQSYETENDVLGVFLVSLMTCLERASEGKLKLQEHIQKPDDNLPLDGLKTAVDELVAKELRPRKLAQQSMLTGTLADGGVAFDAAEPPPEAPKVAAGPPPLPPAKLERLRKLLVDAAVPPIKSTPYDNGFDFRFPATFDEKKLEPYFAEPGEDTDLRKAVKKAQALLFAAAAAPVPAGLAEAVKEARQTLRRDLTIMRDGYRVPRNEAQFKNQVLNDEKDVARILARFDQAHEDMVGVADKREAEPKRWQANYDFMLARLEEEIAYLFEYQSMLGQMRKELPPLDRQLYNGWKLAATTSLSGDSAGRKMASSSRKTLDKIIKDHPGTPWEILAKREKLTALGLEWKPAK